MHRRILLIVLVLAMCLTAAACGSKGNNSENTAPIADGTYTVDFKTDSTMFHINEAYNGKGTLTVKDGKMTIHITLISKSIVNLYQGTADDAQKDGAKLLEPTTDTVKYSDGTTDEVYGFDVPVPYLDKEFDLALIGTKGKWYDHMVKVSDVQVYEEDADKLAADKVAELIDAIYVQNYTEDTYENCEKAKEAWDALTDGMYGDMPKDPLIYDAIMESMGF